MNSMHDCIAERIRNLLPRLTIEYLPGGIVAKKQARNWPCFKCGKIAGHFTFEFPNLATEVLCLACQQDSLAEDYGLLADCHPSFRYVCHLFCESEPGKTRASKSGLTPQNKSEDFDRPRRRLFPLNPLRGWIDRRRFGIA